MRACVGYIGYDHSRQINKEFSEEQAVRLSTKSLEILWKSGGKVLTNRAKMCQYQNGSSAAVSSCIWLSLRSSYQGITSAYNIKHLIKD